MSTGHTNSPNSPNSPNGPSRTTRPLLAAVVALIIVGLVTAGWIILKEFQVQKSVYTKILDQKLASTQDQFRLFLNPFGHHMETIGQWAQSGLLDLNNPQQIHSLVAPLLNNTQQATGAYFFPEGGQPQLLLRKGAQWELSTINSTDLDSLTLSWIKTAPEHQRPHWSHYLELPGDQRTGLIISHAVKTPAGKTLIYGLGLPEADLDQFTASAPITENGILIRRFKDGTVAWLTPHSGNRLDITESGDLMTSGRPEHAVISQALRVWGKEGRTYRTPFRFKEEGQAWWCSFYPAETGYDPGELGLIAPVSDLGHRLEKVTGWVTLLLVGLLALAMTAVVTVAFDYRNKWRRFARRKLDSPQSEQDLANLIAAGESDQVEFKSTMRWNLHADKPGKEMELAWLKSVAGYLNTSGGFLLIGVKDDGTVLGLESDKFQNEDKFILHYDNLIKQHVGLEFASYIKGEIRDLAGQRVFLISCDRCEKPVYLRNGDEETFYIRVGASTRKLPISRISGYLQERNQ